MRSTLIFACFFLSAINLFAARVEVVGAIGGAVDDYIINGNIAYVQQGSNLQIYDASDPSHLKKLGALHMPGLILDMARHGSILYLAVADYGPCIVNAADPLHPKSLGRFKEAGRTMELSVEEDTLQLWTGYKRIEDCEVFDLSKPETPRSLGTIPSRDNWLILGRIVYHVSLDDEGTAQLKYGDVSDLSENSDDKLKSLHLSGKFEEPSFELFYDRRTLQILRGTQELRVFVDVSNPAEPKVLPEGYKFPDPPDPRADGANLHRSKLAEALDESSPIDHAQAVNVSGSFALVSNGTSEVVIIDVTDPSTPNPRGTVMLNHAPADGIAIKGQTAYVTSADDGLTVINFSNPDAPVIYNTYRNWVGKPRIFKNYCYLAGKHELLILDITNPLTPKKVGTLELKDECTDFAIAETSAVLTGKPVRILDLTNPKQPPVAFSFPPYLEDPDDNQEKPNPDGVTATRVVTAGTLALTAPERSFDFAGPACLLDLSNPMKPIRRDTFEFQVIESMAIGKEWACIAWRERNTGGGTTGLQFVRLSDSDKEPNELEFEELAPPNYDGAALNVTESNGLFYVANGNSGIIVLRVDDSAPAKN